MNTAGCSFPFSAHTPDNSFMGFVVEQHLKGTSNATVRRKNQAVVYGKALYMWQVGIEVLEQIKSTVWWLCTFCTICTVILLKSDCLSVAVRKRQVARNSCSIILANTSVRPSNFFIRGKHAKKPSHHARLQLMISPSTGSRLVGLICLWISLMNRLLLWS